MSESVPVVDEEGGKAETVLSSSFHLRPSLRGDDGDDFLEVDEDNGHQEYHQDVKTCPYPFSCFNGRNLFRQKTNDATGVSTYYWIIIAHTSQKYTYFPSLVYHAFWNNFIYLVCAYTTLMQRNSSFQSGGISRLC